MMHLLVDNTSAWHKHIISTGISEKYSVKVSDVIDQPWHMLDFVVYDPSGVLWRIGQICNFTKLSSTVALLIKHGRWHFSSELGVLILRTPNVD